MSIEESIKGLENKIVLGELSVRQIVQILNACQQCQDEIKASTLPDTDKQQYLKRIDVVEANMLWRSIEAEGEHC